MDRSHHFTDARCPKCGSDKLSIDVQVYAHILDGALVVPKWKVPYWDHDSGVVCTVCVWEGKMKDIPNGQ